ncbi:MAG: methyltransferase domain-containing protein [Nocardiopsaceae bacterium]|nr:methyltransferase domain-containing protein [Nocardiopsaceae bacterium]
MTTAGNGTPGPRGAASESPARPGWHQRREGDPARPYVPRQPGAANGTGTRRDWNATDELGYFRTEPWHDDVNPLFADPLADYVTRSAPSPVSVLQAGCLAPLRELGLGRLTGAGFGISVTVADEDTPLTRQVLDATGDGYDDVITGDLRTAVIPPRAFDIVYCAGLLERVGHVELVLDHLAGALKPGGLLMVRMGDRRTASALLDRILPDLARRRLWRDLHPGAPGPFPAVYEKPVSEHGISSYALMRGLVIANRAAEPTLQANPARLSSTVRAACTVIARLTRDRFTDNHDELLYVIRKPEDRFARVL